MDYRELIRIILRRWWLIALPVLLGAGLVLPDLISAGQGAASGFTTQISYSAAQKLNLPERDGDYTDVWQASEYTIDAFTDWVRGSSFRGEVSQHLGDPAISLESLSIAADNAGNIGVVYLQHRDRESLQAAAEAVMLVMSNRSQSYFPQLGGEAAQVTILDQPTISPIATPLTARLAPLMRLAVAFFIGLALAFFVEFVDPRIHHQDDLRRMGLPVLGSIPKQRA